MQLPDGLAQAVEKKLGSQIRCAEPVRGGMINQAAKLFTRDGVVFLKWKRDAPMDFFAAEADGLERLRAANAIRVPQVIAYSDTDDSEAVHYSFLAMEFIDSKSPQNEREFVRTLAEQLAALHRTHWEGGFGLDRDNFIGVLPQRNTWCAKWPEFYRDCRILPQVEIARTHGRLPERRERLLMKVVDSLDRLLDGTDQKACLIHGDLWSGNYVAAGEEPVVVDPAVYFAAREMEVAFIELFGGFPDGLIAAYKVEHPLCEGYECRRSLYQLYPLLVHLNHFGETYGPDVEAACASYVH